MRMINGQDIKMKNQVAPLIDVVFLLLIYFMVTAQIVKKEGDISFKLPVSGVSIDSPVEAYIQIAEDGTVFLDGLRFMNEDHGLPELVEHMADLKRMADAQQSVFFVTLAPEDAAKHQRIIEVMAACKHARVRHLMFDQRKT